MFRYQNVKYNDIMLSSFCEVEEIRLPALPQRTVSSLDIASRDGLIYNGKKYNDFTIEIDVLIDCDSKDELQEKLRTLRDCFDVDEPKAFFINDDRFILAITEDGIEKEPIAHYSYTTTITLLCCEPYFYSTDLKLATIEDDKTLLVENNGKRPILPLISVGFSNDAYFTQLELKETGERILIGKYPTLSLESVNKSTRRLYNVCKTTSDWIQSSASIDGDRTVGGTLAMTSDGNGVMIGSLPSGDTTWKGSCYRQNLDSEADEFKVRVIMLHKSTGINGDPTHFDPDKVTEEGTTITGEKTTYWEVRVSGLNYRTGASVSKKSLGKLPKGHKITDATTVSDSSGTTKRKWLKFTYNGSTVYACREESGVTYIEKYTEDGTTVTTPTITTKNMMVYDGTGKLFRKVALKKTPYYDSVTLCTIPNGEIVRVISSKQYYDTYTDSEGKEQTVYFYKLAKKYNGYMGYIRVDELARAGDVTISYQDIEEYEGADEKTGVCELYGFDVNGSQLFKMSMYDDNTYYEHTRPMARIGNEVVLSSEDAPKPTSATTGSGSIDNLNISIGYRPSGTFGDWNDCRAEWILTKQKVGNKYVWQIEVNKKKDGKVIKTQRTTELTSSDFPTGALSYIVIYMGTSDTLDKSSDMSINHVEVDELNPSEELEGKNVLYFKANDVLDIDFENHRCFLNDEPCDNLVDIGSRYFELPVGESEINVFSNDSDIYANVVYREKWIGED